MNKLLVIAAVAAFASSANAAPAKTSAKSRKTMNVAAAPAKTAQAQNKIGTTASPVPSRTSPGPGSPATGSNVLTTDQQPKKAPATWTASAVTEVIVAATEANNPELNDRNVESTNYVGLGYQATTANKIGFRQYFSTNHSVAKTEPGKEAPAKTETTMMDPAITISHKGGKLFGSDAITPTLYYFIPTSDTSRAANSNGSLRLDAEIDFTLTPKWTVGYYMSGRQSLVPDSSNVVDGKVVDTFARTSYIHYGVLYYNVSDAIQAYTYGGFIHRFQSSTFVLNEESPIAGLGTSFGMFDGVLTVNPELALEIPSVKNFADVSTGGAAFSEKNLKYQLVAALSF